MVGPAPALELASVPGAGSGLGDGYGGGTGGGAYQVGNGVTRPDVIREVKPQYTSDAMRAKVQGTVLVQCVVRPDGSVGDVQVLRSLDPTFGLDQEAIKAARQWRFRPGTQTRRARSRSNHHRADVHAAIAAGAAGRSGLAQERRRCTAMLRKKKARELAPPGLIRLTT